MIRHRRRLPPARIGVIGDIHGRAAPLAQALAALCARGDVDCVVAVGDVVDGRGDVDRCCELLLEHRVAVVRGNHERWMAAGQMRSLPHATIASSLSRRSRSFLASIPSQLIMPVAGGSILVAHGVGTDDMRSLPVGVDDRLVAALRRAGILPRSCLGLISGHSHRRSAARVGRVMFVNAGTLVTGGRTGYGILDCSRRSMSFHDI